MATHLVGTLKAIHNALQHDSYEVYTNTYSTRTKWLPNEATIIQQTLCEICCQVWLLVGSHFVCTSKPKIMMLIHVIMSASLPPIEDHMELHNLNIQLYRLQLKRGLFWYRHHPKMYEMVSDRSSRADNLTKLRKVSMRVFFNSKKCGRMRWSKKHKHVVFLKANL